MKKLILIIFCLALVGCRPADERVRQGGKIALGRAARPDTLRYYIVNIDGQDYFVTSVQGGWSMCPKLR